MIIRRLSVVATLSLVMACNTDAVAPENTVVGRFGGPNVELVATPEGVRVQWSCNFAQFRTPLVPSADGAFSFSPTLVPLGNGKGTAAVALRGVARSMEIEFDAVWLAPSGEVTTSHFVVRANEAGDYSLACGT
jgi:hypothetical protein